MIVMTMCSFMLKGPLNEKFGQLNVQAQRWTVRSRVEGPNMTENRELPRWEDLLQELARRVCQQLSHVGADADTREASVEELVDKSPDANVDQTDYPGAECQSGLSMAAN